MISSLKDVKEAIEGNINFEDKSKNKIKENSDKKGGKLDRYITIAAAKLAVKVVGLQVKNEAI